MSGEALKALLKARLAPPEAWRPDLTPRRSDYDLNPGHPDGDVRPKLRAAAVLVPVIARPEGPTVLLTLRSSTLSKHGGQIAFPGGRLDPGETAVEAALREASEEIALAPDQVEILGLGEPYETVTGYVITPVVGWLAAAPHVVASEAEVADIFETPWAFLMDPTNHRRDFMDLETGPRRWFWAVPWEDRYIWGATAGVIRALHARLFDDDEAAA